MPGIDIGRDQIARLMRAGRDRRARRAASGSAPPNRDPGAGAASRSGRSRVHRDRAQSAVGDRSDVRADVGRGGLRLLHHRRVLRMIVGWRVAGHMRTTMVLDAIEMARWSAGNTLRGLRCHSDAGSQFTSIRYGERLAEIGAVPSIGTVGDSFDNALAETVNGYYKAELIRGPARTGPWKTVEDVELATLGWVHWHNTSRLHGYLGDYRPPSSKPRSTLRNGPTRPWSKSNSPSLHQNQGVSIRLLDGFVGCPR